MLTKEEIDKQLAGQMSSTPFMSMRDSQNKRVSFNTPEELEQKIDRLTVMMGKLVTEDKGFQNHLSHECISPVEAEIRKGTTFTVGSEIMPVGDAPHIIKILEVEVTLVIEETMDTMQEVIRDIGTIIMTI